MKHSTYTSYDDLPLMLSVAEVAAVLGISRAGAYELARSNSFPALKIGSRIVVPKDKFLAWIDANSGSKNAPLQPKKNPLHRSHNSHHKQNHNSHVNKFSSLPFVAVITNREAYRGSARNSSRAARPCGAAAPRSGDAHGARLRSEGSLLLSDVPSVHAKMAKYALLTAARAEVPDHAARAESSDSTHHLKHPLFRRVSRCVRSCE